MVQPRHRHDLVMMAFRVRLKITRTQTQSRLRFNFEKSRNPDMAGTFQLTVGEKIALFINLRGDGIEIDSMIMYNTAVTDSISEILERKLRRNKPWLTRDVLDLL